MCDYFDKLVYTNPLSLSSKLCDDIIQLFENDDSKYKGVSQLGLNTQVKVTTDLNIRQKIKLDDKWRKIHDLLIKELTHNLRTYIDNFQGLISDNKYQIFYSCNLGIQTMLVQKYKKDIGFFKYHNDEQIDWENQYKRVLVFIWYLNDINEGGETEFCGTYKIKPEIGKLIIFPAEWTFPHKGIVPISSDKYIITGWVFTY